MKKILAVLFCLFFANIIYAYRPYYNFEKYRKALVSIKITTTFQEKSDLFIKEENGAGFIVHPEGWIMTNLHVVESLVLDDEVGIIDKKMEIMLSDGRVCNESKKDLIKCFPEKDIALFRVDCPLKSLPFLQISENQPENGNEIILLRFEEKRFGVVISITGPDGSILISTPFKNGWSGSPILDKGNKVIGMTAFFYFEKNDKEIIERYAVVPVKKNFLKFLAKSEP